MFCAPPSFSGPFAVDLKTTYLLKSCDNDFRPSFESDTLFCAPPNFYDPFAVDITTMLQEKVKMGSLFCAPPKILWFFVLTL